MAPAKAIDRTKDPKALICACWQLSTRAIEMAIDDGEKTVSEIASGCGAGGGCGSCRADVEKILLRKIGRIPESEAVEEPASESQLSLFDDD